MKNANLEQLAQRLQLPENSLAGVAGLDAAQLQTLVQAVDAAQAREHEAVDQALEAALFWPLRRWLAGALRR